ADGGHGSRRPPGHAPGSRDVRARTSRREVARRAQPLLAPAVPIRDGSRAAPERRRALVSAVRVRPARPDESAILAEMANDLNDHVGIHGRPFTPERVRADGFGPEAAFTPLVAELDGAVAGYAFFRTGYNPDIAARAMWLHDIFVIPAARGRGGGHALMAAVAGGAGRMGGVSV